MNHAQGSSPLLPHHPQRDPKPPIAPDQARTLLLAFVNEKFTELLKAIAGTATNILSDRLRILVSQGILAVTPGESDGRKLVYSLSSKGSALEPVLAELEAWASKYCSPPERDR